jgi:hypothetical protein
VQRYHRPCHFSPLLPNFAVAKIGSWEFPLMCLAFRDGSNTRSTWRFKARMTPMRAIIVIIMGRAVKAHRHQDCCLPVGKGA